MSLTGNAGWGVWERMVPDQIGPDPASQRLLQLHQLRYQIVAGFVANKRVLDIACGVGDGSDLLSQAGATSVTGVDLSLEAITYAQTHYSRMGLTFVQADAERFESPDLYDIVVSFETLEHLQDPTRFLKQIHPLLNPQGYLFLSVPLGETRFLDPYHQQIFTQKQVFDLLTQTGFTPELYRRDNCIITLSQLLYWRQIYPESRPPLQQILSLVGHLILQGGHLSIPQLMIMASRTQDRFS